MKSIFMTLAVAVFFQVSYAQSDRYKEAMQKNIVQIDSARTTDDWTNLANTFERIAEAEKTQWLPFYYAALSNVMNGFQMASPQGGNMDKLDPLADKAQGLITKAESLTTENSEIFIIKKLIATLYMISDPQSRWQTYGAMSTEALQKAKSLNPENPRVYLIEGQDKFFTPEEFGGSKTEAKKLFDESERKFSAFKPESPLHPQWGLAQLKYFQTLAQ